MNLTEYLIEVSDRCMLIASRGRQLVGQLDAVTEKTREGPLFRSLSTGGNELSDAVEKLGQELLAKAVELDAVRDRAEQAPPSHRLR